MFKITLQQALIIQAKQIVHYGFLYPGGEAALKEEMAKRTNVKGLDLQVERDIVEVNRLVPRGGDIENLVLHKDMGGS